MENSAGWLPIPQPAAPLGERFLSAILEEKSITRLFFARLCRRNGGPSANATPTLRGQRRFLTIRGDF